MSSRVGYADALKILGADDQKSLKVVDTALGGAILATTVATGQLGILALLDARDELLKYGRKLLNNVGQRIRGAVNKDRADLLAAAHTVLVIDAYFETLRNTSLPVDMADLKLTAEEELMLAGSAREAVSRKLVAALLDVPVPIPGPYRPYEQTVTEVRGRFSDFSHRLLAFITGLSLWDGLDETKQGKLADALLKEVPDNAARKYEENFRRLATECAEFRMWISLTDGAATRVAIEKLGGNLSSGLTGLETLLRSLALVGQAAEWSERLGSAYRAQLDRPIAETSPGEGHSGLVIPTVSVGYVNPRFRVAVYGDGARPADEGWWERAVPCDDTQWFLAGYLSSPVSRELPLVLLGQPGSGKSLLTTVLAARLPPTEYLPVRVRLRAVPADAPVQDQIECALREVTGEQMRWPDLVRGAGDALPVVMLDGFDELLQGTGVSHSDYLEQVREFQRRESELGRPVAVIVTSRTVVADRVRVPDGTVLAKMEPFTDDQIAQWLAVWNAANAGYFEQAGLRPLPNEAVLAQRDLAGQPLLLLMLAFFDADGNALQAHESDLGRGELYERLLAKFVDREIDKLNPGLDERPRLERRNRELHQLSIIAFGMFNRGQQSISEKDLDTDLAQLLPEEAAPAVPSGRIALALTPAQLALGRFFFMHRSQALVDTASLNKYEFLHATFGEYLVADLTLKMMMLLLKLRKAGGLGISLRPGTNLIDDGLWELLSFTPLSDDTQTIAFLAEKIRRLPDAERVGLAEFLADLFRASLRPRLKGYGGYMPRNLTVPTRHAVYSANLLALNVLASGSALSGRMLFASDTPIEHWRSFALLWKSQLDPAGWDGLVNTFEFIRAPGYGNPDFLIRQAGLRPTEPLETYDEVNWLASQEAVDSGKLIQIEELAGTPSRTALQASFLCIPEIDLLIHAAQPLLQLSPQGFNTLTKGAEGRLSSVVHQVAAVLISIARTPPDERRPSDLNKVLRIPRVLTTLKDAKMRDYIVSIKDPDYIMSTKALDRVMWDTTATSTRAHGEVDTDKLISILSASIPYISSYRGDNAPLYVITLHLAAMKSDNALGQASRLLPDLKNAFSSIDALQLAKAEPPFIADVIELAQDQGFAEWAGFGGLTVLAALPVPKIQELPISVVEFVLSSAGVQSENAGVIQLIRDRYNAISPDLPSG